MHDPAHPEKGPWIADLQAKDHFVGFYLARDIRLRSFRDPGRGRYLRMSLMDKTGSIEARVWENAEEVETILQQPAVVKVEGEVELFQDRPQVRVVRLRLAEPDESDKADLLASTKRDIDTMLGVIDRTIASIENKPIQRLLQHFFEDPSFRQAFRSAPAARRIHHAYLGGLLEHTFEILSLAAMLLDLYPEIDRDLLTAGILLHDIGKLREFEWELDFEYTDEGRLLGHVVPGAEMAADAAKQIEGFPAGLVIQLQHLILSHHGRYEWGSPRRPKTLEAIALHHLENLDGQVNRFLSLMQKARLAGQKWTSFDHLLGRSLYAGMDDDQVIEEQDMAE